MDGVILGNTQKLSIKSWKLIEVGLTNLLTKSDRFIHPPNTVCW